MLYKIKKKTKIVYLLLLQSGKSLNSPRLQQALRRGIVVKESKVTG